MLSRTLWGRSFLGVAAAFAALISAQACGGGSGDGSTSDGADAAAECGPGESRPCERANAFGRCAGVEPCVSGSFGTCDAPEAALESCNGIDDDCDGNIDEDSIMGSPACMPPGSLCPGRLECQEGQEVCVEVASTEEVCDLIDNDCDGDVDEGFRREDGIYLAPEHCGSCNNDCADVHPLAITTQCQLLPSGPRCIATECPQGTALAPGGLGCIVLTTRLCEPCQTDSDCSTAVGDVCQDYPDGRFCGRDCGASSLFGTTCPRGFVCVADQCRLPPGSSCTCDADDSFDKPCDFTNATAPDRICAGIEVCDRGSFGPCVPPAETCNRIDDNCDGTIDEGFVDPITGLYSVDPRHCGDCGVDCVALFSNPMVRTVGACGEVDGELRCVPGCEPGFGDANGAPADGCECTVTSAVDAPDFNGMDANCDGVDGNVTRAVFVSSTGNDANPGTRDGPVKTIQRGIDVAAVTPGLDHVYVAEGIYDESVSIVASVSVFGSYSPDFSRHDPLGHTSVIIGAAPVAGKLGAVNAIGITSGTALVDGFAIRASTTPTPAGNSYAVYVLDSNDSLALRFNRIIASPGRSSAPAPNGADGLDANGVARRGDDARVAAAQQCTTETTLGGLGAMGSCAVQGSTTLVNTSGGRGGSANCPVDSQDEGSGLSGNPSATGGPGGDGGYGSLLVDLPGGSGPCAVQIPRSPPAPPSATEEGLPGVDGIPGTDGAAGARCVANRGSVVGGEWRSAAAGRGTGGQPGGGAGGGGASGGIQIQGVYNVCTDANNLFGEGIGSAGGGGGAGGCGGFGGEPGASGGGSFGVFATFTSSPSALPRIDQNIVERSFGGAGAGAGGGGQPGVGSGGALGGVGDPIAEGSETMLNFIEPGGRGGDGGRGGFGGGGGGGCGGASVGVFFNGIGGLQTAMIRTGNTFPSTGGAGLGGNGGPSAGSPGPDGSSGLFLEVSP